MSPEVFAILQRHYGYAKGAQKKRGPLSPAERALVSAAGYPVGATLALAHDECLRRLTAAAALVRPEEVTAAFVAGVGGSALRGRQVLVSYAHARHLPDHAASPTPGYINCRTCGIDDEVSADVTERAVRGALGFVWNEGEGEYFLDLEEFLRLPKPIPTPADRGVLRAVLQIAAGVAPGCTPGQLEKELAGNKVIPSSDKYARYGILEALAMVGVLPNPVIAPAWDRLVTRTEVWEAGRSVKGSARSDIVLPFAAWRGVDGVDWARATEFFGVGPAA